MNDKKTLASRIQSCVDICKNSVIYQILMFIMEDVFSTNYQGSVDIVAKDTTYVKRNVIERLTKYFGWNDPSVFERQVYEYLVYGKISVCINDIKENPTFVYNGLSESSLYSISVSWSEKFPAGPISYVESLVRPFAMLDAIESTYLAYMLKNPGEINEKISVDYKYFNNKLFKMAKIPSFYMDYNSNLSKEDMVNSPEYKKYVKLIHRVQDGFKTLMVEAFKILKRNGVEGFANVESFTEGDICFKSLV